MVSVEVLLGPAVENSPVENLPGAAVPSGAAQVDWAEQAKRLSAASLLAPFAREVCEFIQEVSKRLLLKPEIKAYPELASFAFFWRGERISLLKQRFREDQGQGEVFLPRGVVFHLAPANVDTVFLYSWFFSLLAGNSNIVRLSTRRGDQVGLILACLREILEEPQAEVIRSRNLILSYKADDNVSLLLSSLCDLRVIWGGDNSVMKIRSIPLPPRAHELVFADRFSIAVFRAERVLSLDNSSLSQLERNFYNDAFFFSQQACSSPKLLIWVGKGEQCRMAKERFWPGFNNFVREREPAGASGGLSLLEDACVLAEKGEVTSIAQISAQAPFRAQISELGPALRTEHQGAGFFPELETASLEDVAGFFTGKDQTLSYFGFSPEELQALVRVLPRGAIDRIVPVGRALEFSVVWDGQNFLRSYSRIVSLVL